MWCLWKVQLFLLLLLLSWRSQDRFERRLSAYTKQRLVGLAEAGGKALEVSDRKHALVQSLLSMLRDRSFRARAAGTDRLTP